MFNIAFNFVHTPGGQSGLRDAWTNLLTDERPAENSESDSNKELVPENSEFGFFVPQTALISPIESPSQGDLNESIFGYKNHVSELNSRPPKVA
jgi:hypothetical protein